VIHQALDELVASAAVAVQRRFADAGGLGNLLERATRMGNERNRERFEQLFVAGRRVLMLAQRTGNLNAKVSYESHLTHTILQSIILSRFFLLHEAWVRYV
jgi:hypothetical protein